MTNFKKKYLKYKYKYEKLKYGSGPTTIKNLISIVNIYKNGEKNYNLERFIFLEINEFYSKLIDRKYDVYYIIEKNNDLNILFDTDEEEIVFISLNSNGHLVINEDYELLNNIFENYKGRDGLPHIKSELIKQNIYLTKLTKESNCASLNIDELKIKLEELNLRLQENYPELRLELDIACLLTGNKSTYRFAPIKKNVLLCLYYEGNCISSITFYLKPLKNILEIHSKTHENKLGRKYNKLLRSIVIILMSFIKCNGKKIDYLFSDAENWISVWTLVSNFDCIVTDIMMDYYKTEIYSEENPYTIDELKENFNKNDNFEVEILVPLNEINIEKAYNLFEKLINKNKEGSIISPSEEIL